MRRELAEKLVELINNYDSAEIYDEYSGRCMYGKTTVGVVLPEGIGISNVLAMVIENPHEFIDEDTDQPIFDCIDNIREDSLGLQTIIY